MPLNVPERLPSSWMLESEGIFALNRPAALRQDIRPLRILLVDLMPAPLTYEVQVARLLAGSSLQVDLEVVRLRERPGIDDQEPLLGRHLPFVRIQDRRYDGMVVSHSPSDHLDWHEDPVWDELRDLLDWSEDHVHARLFLGWSAQAALQHVHCVPRRPAGQALVGVLPQRLLRRSSYLMRGFDDEFPVPVAYSARILADDLLDTAGLLVLAGSDRSGPYLVRNYNRRDVFALHHPEFGLGSLLSEFRSLAARNGGRFDPQGVADEGALRDEALPSWRSHASLLFLNWLNYYVYQPFSHHESRLA